MNLLEGVMASGNASLPDLSPTPVYDSPPMHQAGLQQTDLLNLMWESPEEPVGSSPPKRTRQAESSPGGMTDSTNLEEDVTMEAIARTLQMQLQQERHVLTGEIHRAMSQVNSRVDDVEKVLGDKISDAVGMLQDLAVTQRQQGDKLETVATETQTLANRIVDLEARLQALETGGGGGAGRTTNLLEDDAGNRKPALIIGGWDPDQRGMKPLERPKMSSENSSLT